MPRSEKINTFKFHDFSELIEGSLLLRKRVKLDPNEESHLTECFNEWTQTNLSLEFKELKSELGPKILTLNLLLVNEEEVANILFEKIEKYTGLSLTSVLDLLQNFVCDIRKDFLPYLGRSFELITSVIEKSGNDADMLLNAFNCLAQIMSYLSPYLIKDIHQIIPIIKPLLFHETKNYIRQFSAQSFGYILRRSRDFKSLFGKDILVDLVEGNTSNIHSEAIGHLMAWCITFKDSILPDASKIFPVFYEILIERKEEFFIDCLDEMFKSVLRNISVQSFATFWRLISDQIPEETESQELSGSIIIELFVKYSKNSSLRNCSKSITSLVTRIFRKNSSEKCLEIAKLLMDKLQYSEEVVDLVRKLIGCENGMEMESRFLLMEKYICNPRLELTLKHSMNNYLSSFVNETWLTSDPNNFYRLLTCMTKLSLEKYPISKESEWIEYFDNNSINFNIFFIESRDEKLLDIILEVINGDEQDERAEEILWMTTISLRYFYPGNTDSRILEALNNKLKRIMEMTFCSEVLLKFHSVLDCIIHLNKLQRKPLQVDLDVNKFIEILHQHDYSSSMEPLLLEIISKLITPTKVAAKLTKYQPLFLKKLRSPNHQSRLNSLRILQKILYSNKSAVYKLNTCDEIERLFELHETELVKKERTVINLLSGITFTVSMSKLTRKIIINFLLGLMNVQLSSLWKYLGQTLCSFCVKDKELKGVGEFEIENENIIWSSIEEQLKFCGDRLMSDDDTDIQTTSFSDFHERYIVDKFYKSRSANWLQLRLNIIKLLTKIPDLAAKKTSYLSPLLISIYTNEFSINKNPKKVREETMITMMTLYSKFTNISCTHSEKSLKNLYYKCLSSQNSDLQLAAFLVIVNYKIPELQPYKSQIIEFLNENNDLLKQVSLSLIQPGHRHVMLPIMLRIIIGKLKSISKSKKKNPFISYLMELEEKEMGQLLSVLLEGLKMSDDKCEIVQPDEDIHAISLKIRKCIENETTPQYVIKGYFKALQGVYVSLKMILKGLLNKLSNHNLTMILKIILDFYACCNYVKNNQSVDLQILQLKPLRQECAKMVLFYFNEINSFVWTDELLSEITELMVTPNIEKLVEQNQSSVNITIQLCALWSEKEEMVTLITPDLFKGFVEILGKDKLNRKVVGYQLVNIIYNIMQYAKTGREHSSYLQNIIIQHLPSIIQYLEERIQCMKVKKLSKDNTETTVTRKELSMISICTDYITESNNIVIEEKIILDMINNMLTYLYRSNALILSTSGGTEVTENSSDEVKEQIEVDFLHAIKSLSEIVDIRNLLCYFERFIGLFSRLRKRASRMMLSNLVFELWPKFCGYLNIGEDFNKLGEIAKKLNSWNEKRLGEMDLETISKTIEDVLLLLNKKSVKECIENKMEMQCNLHPKLWMYNLTSQNCLFILTEITEIGTRQIAQDYLDATIHSIAECGDSEIIQVMFFDNIWPSLKYGICSKNESLRYSFIGIIKTVVLKFGHTNRFKDIAKLAISESDNMNFFENMLSLTTAFNSKGLRQLVKFLSKNVVSAQNLNEILLPLVLHRIELISEKYNSKDRTLTNTHRESLSSSFEALTAVSNQLPMNSYKKLISEQMAKLDKGFNVELIIKTLIALINGYNSDIDKVDHSFMVDVLHNLEKHLSKRTHEEIRHKHAQKLADIESMNPKEAEWTVRGMALQVPIALAIINTVVKLPKKYMKEIITRVILRICDFLKAKEEDVRKEAGTAMFQILQIINAPNFVEGGNVKYLWFFIQTVKNNLNRGFQRHVGLNTCHRVLQRLQENNIFDRLTIDYSVVKNMTELYLDELFGDMAKEKSEKETAEKGIVPEAKKVKAFEGLRLLSNVLEKDHLLDFFQLLINTVKEFKSKSDLNKFQEIFESIQGKGGLQKNSRLGAISLFSLSILLIGDHMESLFLSENQMKKVVKLNKGDSFADFHLYQKSERLDSYEAPLEVSLRSSSHLIINCGLNLLHGLSKTYSSSTEINLASMLDPALAYVIKILDNVQYKVIMFSGIKCLREIIRINPSSLSDKVEEVSSLLFRIHNKYSMVSDSRDELGENVARMVNKTITQFIQRPDVHLNPSQYKVLLLSLHVDCLNNKRQMTSFNLLRAIIENRIKDPTDKHVMVLDDVEVQLADIIEKVHGVALLSTNERARSDARATIASYLRHNKPSADFIEDIVVVTIKSMENLDEDGILSACLIMQNILKQHSRDFALAEYFTIIIALIILTINKGTTAKVEEVFMILIHQTVDCINTDQQNELCNTVFNYFSNFQMDNKIWGISFYVMSTILKCIKSENRESFLLKFVNICMENLPLVWECSNKLSEQLAAAKGEDSDLMNHLEKISEPKLKKQKLSEEPTDENEAINNTVFESSDVLSEKMLATVENVNRIIIALSSFFDISENEERQNTDIAILNETIQIGLKNDIWKLVVEQILRNKNAVLRLSASKNIVFKLLYWEKENKIAEDLRFANKEMTNAIMISSFKQLNKKALQLDECDSALLNIVLLWQTILENFSDEIKTDICKTMIKLANHVANDELVNGYSLIRRCAVLKFLAAICSKTKQEDLEKLQIERNILWMWMREERQSQDESESNKKKKVKRHHKTISRYCSSQEIKDWKNLVVEVGVCIKTCFGEDKCKKLSNNIQKERSAQKLKRKITESALAVSNPGEALKKKIKKSKRNV